MFRKEFLIGVTMALLLVACVMVWPVQAKGPVNKGDGKQNVKKVMTNDLYRPMDINNIFNYYSNNGDGSFNKFKTDNEGFEFPIGSYVSTCIFEDGLVWTAFKNDTLYCGGSTYQHGLQAGRILQNGTASSLPVPGDPGNSEYRVYRVRPDIKPTTDPSVQSAELVALQNSEVSYISRFETYSNTDLQNQYWTDWNNWPAAEGAPFTDANGVAHVNGGPGYDPATCTPGFPGADQTEWMVMNDVNPIRTRNLYGSNPIGIEVQRTIWAYNRPGALGNTIFVSYTFINKSGVPLDSMYVSQWADPDLGAATDDAVGCDTTRSLGYVYNGEAQDANFASLGLPPPAVGFDFFQGPMVPGSATDSAIFNMHKMGGYANLPMTAFSFFLNIPGSPFTDPDLNNPDGTPQWYNLMTGRVAHTGARFDTSVTGGSKFCYPGDPVTGIGPTFIGPAAVSTPTDVRMCLISGPFTMQPGDTQQVVVAALAGLGSDYLSSITALRANDDIAQSAYNALFQLAVPPPQPTVSVATLSNQIVLSWGDPVKSAQVENFVSQGYTFEGYNVYQYQRNSPTGGKLLATFDRIDQIKTIQDTTFSIPLGTDIVTPTEYGTDNGIQHSLTINQDAFTGNPIINDRDYYFAVTAYSYNPTAGLVPHALESAPAILDVRAQSPAPGVTVPTKAGAFSNITHTGVSDGSVAVNVIDPTIVTGDQYQVVFHNETYSLGSDGVWTDITAASKAKRKSVQDLTGSSVASTASWSETKGAIDIHTIVDVQSSNYDYCDGVKLQFPAGITVDKITEPISNNTSSPIPYYFDQAANTIFFGDTTIIFSPDTNLRTGNGVFAGGEDIAVTVHPSTLPMLISYTMYDDNFGATYVDSAQGFPFGKLVDVSSVDTLAGPIANKIIVQKQWDVKDLSKNTIALKNQTIVGGQDIYAPTSYFAANSINGPGGSSGSSIPDVGPGANVVFNGIQVVVDGSYDAPTTIAKIVKHVASTSSYDIRDFTAFSGFTDGTAASSLPSYGLSGGVPLTDITDLQQGYELRWTGVLGDTTINGKTVVITKSGGSIATLFGASNYSIANHPLNPNPGVKAPFAIRIPFEIWNIDKNEQVNLLVYDRNVNAIDPTKVDTFSVWREDDRMYAWVVNTAYAPTVLDTKGSAVVDSSTWSLVFMTSQFATGDIIDILYNKPIQIGKDSFTFTVPGPVYSTKASGQDISKINVFPNPYFGFNSLEADKYTRWVRFTHLPQKATIRIFNLAGILVRTIVKNDNTQFADWDLMNEHQLPIAAGMYIAYIDCGSLGTRTLKLAVIPEQQYLDHY